MSKLFCDRCSKDANRLALLAVHDANFGVNVRQRISYQICEACVNGLNYWLHHPAPWLRPKTKKGKAKP